eukprot:EG_transcript_18884
MLLLLAVGCLMVAVPLAVVLLHRPARRELKGKTVLITGAGRGLGRQLALQLAERGCSLVLWDVQPAVLDFAKELPCSAHAFVVDVADEASVQAAAEATLALTEVDILINNAGVVMGRSVLDETAAQTAQVLGVNFFGSCHTTHRFLPAMLRRNSGHVVIVSSIMAHLYACDLASYCASKAALLAWANCLRLEIARTGKAGVHTTVVCPYAIQTDMFKGCRFSMQWLLPLLTVDGVAQAILDALERPTPVVVLPNLLRLAPPVQHLLPPAVMDALLVYLGGANVALSSFQGGAHASAPPQKATGG